jgi:hypothetical protein
MAGEERGDGKPLDLPNLRDAGGHWLFEPKEKRALGDVAKLAVTMRTGRVPVEFLDPGFAGVELGKVGRCVLTAPSDLGLPPSERRFVLARGTDRLCLAEIVAGAAGEAEAARHLEAVARQAERADGKPVVGWLIADELDEAARALLASAGCVASSTRA